MGEENHSSPARPPTPPVSFLTQPGHGVAGLLVISHLEIEARLVAAGSRAGEADLAVLDRFEEVTKRREFMLEFTLQPGEMYFLNNYTILHARTAFDDGDVEEDQRRHLLRLWLEAPGMRPVHPYVRGRGVSAVAGRTPSFDWASLTKNRN